MFPLLGALGFQASVQEWLHLVGLDPAALHMTAFVVESFIARTLRGHEDSINPAAMLHFHKGLHLLRERLSSDEHEAKISDSTMGMVYKLASGSHFNGDHLVARQHMEGLGKMVELRGGLSVFEGKQLLVDMVR